MVTIKEFANFNASSQIAEVLTSALRLLLQVLQWDFSKYDQRQTLPRRATKSEISILAPPTNWTAPLTDIKLIELLLAVHEKYRGNSLTQLVRQSLIQLASLSKVGKFDNE